MRVVKIWNFRDIKRILNKLAGLYVDRKRLCEQIYIYSRFIWSCSNYFVLKYIHTYGKWKVESLKIVWKT